VQGSKAIPDCQNMDNETCGDCASCHTPDVVLNAGHELSLEEAIKKGSNGISCDYCHTIRDVKVIYNP